MASQGAKSEDHSSIESENPDICLATSIEKTIDVLPPISPNHSICRAPKSVCQLNEEAYKPLEFSIGPLHHGKEPFLLKEELKLRYLKAFRNHTKLNLQECLTFVRKWEQKVRNCYEERINLSSDDFVKMIVVDSTFVIEVIRQTTSPEKEDKMDCLINSNSLDNVRTDMILLENQIPYFVIAGLFNLAFPNRSFVNLFIQFFGSVSLLKHIPAQTISESEVKHFVDLLRLCHLPSTPRSLLPNGVKFVTIPTARNLQQVGLNIRKGSSNNILDIQYAEGVLTIPQFGINDESEVILRNLIAFEMCYYQCDSYITDYVVFMDSLMDTAQDVDILVQNEIFESLLFDHASVATLFHNLTSQVLWSSHRYYYHGLCQEVDAYCRVPWNKWKAILKRDYFSTPWRIVAVVVAVILLVLTLIQTVCSVISILQ